MPSALASIGVLITVGSPSNSTSPLSTSRFPDSALTSVDLPGAVVADERDHLAGRDVEVGPVQRGHLPEPAGQARVLPVPAVTIRSPHPTAAPVP